MKIRTLLATGVIALGMLGGTQAATASTIPHTCTSRYGAQVGLGWSKLWLTNVSGCSSGYPIFYNRTECIYRNVIGTFWYDGPTRKGNGSSSSNYSQVTCNQYPFPSVVQVWEWINNGGGWAGKRIY